MVFSGTKGSALVVFSAASILLTSAQAIAGGFAIREQSSEGLGAAFAGVAAGTNDLSSAFWNPATLSLHDGASVQGDIAAILPYANVDVTSSTYASSPVGPVYSSNGTEESGNLGSLAAVPSFYAMYQVNERLRLGVSANSPYGLVNEANRGWAGEFHGVKSSLFTLNVTSMASFDINDYVSVGVGVQVQYIEAALTQEQVIGAVGVLGAPSILAQGRATASDWGAGAVAGILFKPTENTRIGLGYRSQINYSLKGHAEVSTSGTGTTGIFANNGKISAEATLPEMVSLGLRHKISDDWTVMGTVEWTNWSRFNELRIEFNALGGPADNVTEEEWKDGWFFSVGAEHQWNDYLTVRAGAAYEISPVIDRTRTPRIPDNDRIWLAVGGTYKYSSNLSFSLGYTHIFVEDAPINLSRTDEGSALRGDLVGESEAHIDILTISAKYDF